MSQLIRKRSLVVFFLVLASLAVSPVGSAMARLAACRGDPIVFLSDGSKIVITLDIATDASNVQSVVYTVHAPRGTNVKKVIYTGGGLGDWETLAFFADSAPKHYTADAYVVTKDRVDVAMTNTSSLDNVASGATSGYTRQHLMVKLNRP